MGLNFEVSAHALCACPAAHARGPRDHAMMEHGSGVRKAWTRLRFAFVLVLGLLILSNVSTFMYTSRPLNSKS